MKSLVLVEWDRRGGRSFLTFSFPTRLTAEAASEAIQRWREAFTDHPDEKITLVWDCRDMKGYDSRARQAWQNAITEMKDRVEGIWLVSGSAFVRMGAMVMGKATSLPIQTVNSLHDVAA